MIYIYILALVILLYGLRQMSQGCLLSLVLLPGTICHETCHYVVGFVLNGVPSRFTVIPKETEDGRYVLGSVYFGNIRWYNAFFMGMAPLVLLWLAYYLLLRLVHGTPAWSSLGWLYLTANLIVSGIPSPADVKIAWGRSPVGYLLILWGLYRVFF